jgi:hypothetical protein
MPGIARTNDEAKLRVKMDRTMLLVKRNVSFV